MQLPSLSLQQSTDGKPGGGVSSPEGAQVTLEDRWDPFSVQGASLEVSTFVTGDMGGDKSLRHRLHAVIDELGLAAPSPSPPPPCRPSPVPASMEQVWGGILHTALFFFN